MATLQTCRQGRISFEVCLTGVRQGDPLGPLLFAVALDPPPLELQNRIETEHDTDKTCTIILSSWYLDDGYIIAHHERLQSALEFLRAGKMRSNRFHRNLSTCELQWREEPPQDVQAVGGPSGHAEDNPDRNVDLSARK